jgi:hypothetical protein
LALAVLTVITTTTERFALPLDHLEALPEMAAEVLQLPDQVDHVLLRPAVVAQEMGEVVALVARLAVVMEQAMVQLIILALQWQEELMGQVMVLVVLVECSITFNLLEMALPVRY